MGSFNTGLDRFNPLDKTFTHYDYNAKDDISISNQTIPAILQDHEGIIWVGRMVVSTGSTPGRVTEKEKIKKSFPFFIYSPQSLVGIEFHPKDIFKVYKIEYFQ